MASGNSFDVVGNVTRDPELAFGNDGRQRCSFGIAYNKRWKNSQTGEWEEEPHFFDVVCWGDLAENVAESITKGDRVFIDGWVQQRTWDDKDGNSRSKHEIVADEVCPSLKWATATIERVKRGDGGGSGGGNRGRSGGNQGGRSGGNRGGQTSVKPDTDLYSDEPF